MRTVALMKGRKPWGKPNEIIILKKNICTHLPHDACVMKELDI
jgi:hypothetical protein